MGYEPDHKPIRAKYRRTPTKREKAYHLWLIERFPCACGCGRESTVVHHPLQEHPDQIWRRNHEFVVPMNWRCHTDLHEKKGSDEYANAAASFRALAQGHGVL